MLEGLWGLRYNSGAYCVTFAQGLDETEMLHRFGGDLSRARLAPLSDEEMRELEQLGQIIQVGWCDGWVFVYEANGYQGTRPETLRAVSKETIAVSVYYSINAHTRFCYVRDGTIIANFDPIDPPYSTATPEVLALLRQVGIPEPEWDDEEDEDDEDEDDYDFVAAMFNLAETVGVCLDEEAIAKRPLLTSYIQ